jgi:AcrR family transcriptional regulator
MPIQARAGATRQIILDAAVGLFGEIGFSRTGLADILNRAGMTKGRFYYHFPSKEALAEAIIDEAAAEVSGTFRRITESPESPALQSLIRGIFEVVSITMRDDRVRMANLLRQSLTHVSDAGPATYVEERKFLLAAVERAIAEGDLVGDIDADAVTQAIWTLGSGTLLLAEATGDDAFFRLTQVWSVILLAIVPATSQDYFQQFIARTAQQYADTGSGDPS